MVYRFYSMPFGLTYAPSASVHSSVYYHVLSANKNSWKILNTSISQKNIVLIT